MLTLKKAINIVSDFPYGEETPREYVEALEMFEERVELVSVQVPEFEPAWLIFFDTVREPLEAWDWKVHLHGRKDKRNKMMREPADFMDSTMFDFWADR